MFSFNPRIAGCSSWETLPQSDRWAGYRFIRISLCHDDARRAITHSVLLDRIVAEDLCALFNIVDGLRVTEFQSLEVIVEHLSPTECTFRKLVTSWVIGRPRENSVSRITVVIHLASFIALVLEFEPYGDVHGGRVSPVLYHFVPVINDGG